MLTLSLTTDQTPDLFVRVFGGRWCPAFRLTSTFVAGAARTSIAVTDGATIEILSPERLDALASANRVMCPMPLLTVVNDDPPAPSVVPDPLDAQPGDSERLADILNWEPHDVSEALRKMLCARCVELAKLDDSDADVIRHDLAADVSGGRTESSLDLTGAERAVAIRKAEILLQAGGFDIEASDAAYFERRAKRKAA